MKGNTIWHGQSIDSNDRDIFSREEKTLCLELSVNRSKVNTKSKFNESFKEPCNFDDEWSIVCVCISAELYDREQATEILHARLKDEILCHDYDQLDDEEKQVIDKRQRTINFWFVKMWYCCYRECRVWQEYDNYRKLTNFCKPVRKLQV